MTNPLHNEIQAMDPVKYARTAKRAAKAAARSAIDEGIEVSARIRHLLDATEEQLAEEQRKRLESRLNSAPAPTTPENDVGGSAAAGSQGISRPAPTRAQSQGSTVSDAVRAAVENAMSSATWRSADFGIRSPVVARASSSLLPIWLDSEFERAIQNSAPAGVQYPVPAGILPMVADNLPLNIGQGAGSADGSWRATLRPDGNLAITLANSEPWLTPIADDEQVAVNVATRTIVVSTTRARRSSGRTAVAPMHERIKSHVFDHLQIIQILPEAPAVVTIPIMSGSRFALHSNDYGEKEAQRASTAPSRTGR